ncbi:hypothetical protein ABHA39_04115 [Clostridium paraputrificum]|uniref:hypothetical protein n=1 Tax=Clostridium paraputrificum TaxID=29363 RepID=UPI00232E73A5|nr:hypothetical protein [Clostridium paraputrificum]MDB2071400.1 hypothetical protein [Clostridium paraputrificum]MDB2081687.1 hypothetical protein [Clostridium paraputrificum]
MENVELKVKEELEIMGFKVEGIEVDVVTGRNPRTKEEITFKILKWKTEGDRSRRVGIRSKNIDEILKDVREEYKFGKLDDYELTGEITSLDKSIDELLNDNSGEFDEEFKKDYVEERKHLLNKNIRSVWADSINDTFMGEIFIDENNKIVDRIGY